jgi:hypothetical protein
MLTATRLARAMTSSGARAPAPLLVHCSFTLMRSALFVYLVDGRRHPVFSCTVLASMETPVWSIPPVGDGGEFDSPLATFQHVPLSPAQSMPSFFTFFFRWGASQRRSLEWRDTEVSGGCE